MKALTLIITMMAFITLSSFKQDDKKVDQVLQNQNTRKEVFNQILNNRELMIDFMNAMHGNQQAMMMWNQNYRHMQSNGKATNNSSSMMGGNNGSQMMKSGNTNSSSATNNKTDNTTGMTNYNDGYKMMHHMFPGS